MESPKKNQRRQSSKERTCIICSKQLSESELTKPRDGESIHVLLNAARIQNFAPITDLEELEYEEHLFHHRNCRASFTHKKTLEKFVETAESECSTETRSSRGTSSTSRVLETVCIFCEKKSKYASGSNTREVLLQSRAMCADEKVRNAALAKLDDRILAITSWELVAAEAHYHKTCYRNYTREEKQKPNKTIPTEDDEVAYKAAEQESYLLLFRHIRETLLVEPTVGKMTVLTEKLVNYMHSFGYNDVKSQTKKHIRRKLEYEFGKSLHFVPDNSGKLLVYPDSLSSN